MRDHVIKYNFNKKSHLRKQLRIVFDILPLGELRMLRLICSLKAELRMLPALPVGQPIRIRSAQRSSIEN